MHQNWTRPPPSTTSPLCTGDPALCCTHWDSNPQPLQRKVAHANHYTALCLVHYKSIHMCIHITNHSDRKISMQPAGVEPKTSAMEVRCADLYTRLHVCYLRSFYIYEYTYHAILAAKYRCGFQVDGVCGATRRALKRLLSQRRKSRPEPCARARGKGGVAAAVAVAVETKPV